MKKLLILILLLTAVYTGNGQILRKKETGIRTGLTSSFFTTGDETGLSLYSEFYQYQNRYLAAVVRLMTGSTFNQEANFFSGSTETSVSVAARFRPFPKNFDRFTFDLGGAYVWFKTAYGNRNLQNPPIINADWFKRNNFGLVASVSLDVIKARRVRFGLRGDGITMFEGSNLEAESWHLGPYVNIKF